MRRTWIACGILLAGSLVWRASAQETGFRGEFSAFEMVDADTGWAVGRSGITAALVQTHDGGKSWTDISPQPFHYQPIKTLSDAEEKFFFHLTDATHGWASVKQEEEGGTYPEETLFSTDDGGRTWKRNAFKTTVGSISTIQFPDSRHGFILVESDPAVGHSQKATYRTTDGGKTWWTTSESSHQIKTDHCLPGIGFCAGMVLRDAKEGWVNGSPRGDEEAFLFRTKDAGDSWKPQFFKAPAGFFRGYAEINTPQFFGDAKTDGVLSVHFIQHDPEQRAFAFYRTRDGGEQWSRVGFSPEGVSDEVSPSFADEDRGWLLADKRLFATTDGGAKWRELATNLRFGDKESDAQFYFVSANVGWLVKDLQGDASRYELLRTTDGGCTWTHCCGPQGELAPLP